MTPLTQSSEWLDHIFSCEGVESTHRHPLCIHAKQAIQAYLDKEIHRLNVKHAAELANLDQQITVLEARLKSPQGKEEK